MRTVKEIEKELAEAREHEEKLKKERDDARRAEIRKANEEARKRTESLRKKLEEEYGIVGHPKAGLLWSKAWERGHAYGLSEVENVYSDLVDLIL